MRRLLFWLALLLIFTSCKKKVEPVSEPVAEPEPPVQEVVVEEKQPEPEPLIVKKIENKAVNPLTGLLIDIEDYKKRPYAVMINNMWKALPQSGIGDADVIYEVLAEGGITRMLAVFHEYKTEKIGPIRSARHYYLDLAFDNDAIYVHHGGSPQGYDAIRSRGTNNLDGMQLDGTSFWRDEQRLKTPGMYEHSSFTSSQNIYDTAAEYGYRVESLGNIPNMFGFYNIHKTVGAAHDETLEMRFSGEQTANFKYNPATKLYERSQNGEPQIDELTGEQVTVSNVIAQYANIYVIPGDPEGRRNVELVSSGKGMLYTGGTAQEIRWSKESSNTPTEWRDLSGNKLKLNQGKTWICIINEPAQ